MKKAFMGMLLLAALLLGGCTHEDEEICREEQYSAKPVIYIYPEETSDAKPVIYLRPEAAMDVTVQLDYAGTLTCTYPAYDGGWHVSAAPDGTLTDASGQTYRYLYWEGRDDTEYDLSRGFCVPGDETAAFLEEALDTLGLTRAEANEFIIYWLPKMQESPYNLIAFQTDAYTQSARLTVTPEPDTMLRVFMAWTALDEPVELLAQELSAPERRGFTVVEWGGAELRTGAEAASAE